MQSIKMNRQELLNTLQANKQQHVALYYEAIEQYKTEVINLTQYNMNLASTRDIGQIEEIQPLPPIPKNFENNYILAIQMLESSAEELVDISQDLYKQLILNNWS